MKYNNLGRSGLRVSEISFGSWLTFGSNLDRNLVKELMKFAVDSGVNFFDNAEGYAKGEAETIMGEALRDFKREDLVISTKIFWGGNGPNDTGLSWKHIIEGTRNSLKRLKVSYIDIIFCHRPDPNTPMEETVRAMDHLIRLGYCFYWGTSEWSAVQIEHAHQIAEKYNCIPPIAEQPQYNIFSRTRVEEEYQSLYAKYELGLTTWSPLASGLLSGKYNESIPAGSRLAVNDWLQKERTKERIEIVKALKEIADGIGCTVSQLAIAWCMMNPRVSSVITGATRLTQLKENLLSLKFKDKMSEETLKAINTLLKND